MRQVLAQIHNIATSLENKKAFKQADKLNNIHFGGRLAEYKYYDMHQVIESALNFIKKEIK